MPEAPTPAPTASWLHRWRSRRVEVRDDSMRPILWPGDRLLVDPRVYRDQPPSVGHVVVIVDPADRSRWLVKRVAAVGPGSWERTAEGLRPAGEREGRPSATERVDLPRGAVWVLGDTPESSRDSRRFGPVLRDGIVGRAYCCYAPVDRRKVL